MKRFASQISGLNTQKFNSYLDSGKCNSLVNNDKAFAISSGFQGTPTFVIERNYSSNPTIRCIRRLCPFKHNCDSSGHHGEHEHICAQTFA
jgi:hypothetical protein